MGEINKKRTGKTDTHSMPWWFYYSFRTWNLLFRVASRPAVRIRCILMRRTFSEPASSDSSFLSISWQSYKGIKTSEEANHNKWGIIAHIHVAVVSSYSPSSLEHVPVKWQPMADLKAQGDWFDGNNRSKGCCSIVQARLDFPLRHGLNRMPFDQVEERVGLWCLRHWRGGLDLTRFRVPELQIIDLDQGPAGKEFIIIKLHTWRF